MKSPIQTLLGTLGININVEEIREQAEKIIRGTQEQAQAFAMQLNRIEHKMDAICAYHNIKVEYGNDSNAIATTGNGGNNGTAARGN